MSDILSFIRAKKVYFIFFVAIILFFIIRTILLQKPSADILYTVKQEDLVDTVQVSGTYTTASQTQVPSPAKGIITKLYVSNGDTVKKGDPLFYVEGTATTDEQNTAYTAYEAALSALQTAQNNMQSLDATMWTKQQAYITAQNTQNYMNNHTTNPSTNSSYTDLEKLAITNAVTQTQKDFQAAEQAYKTANVAVTAAQALATQTKRAYAETQSAIVYAPASGKVVNLDDKVGDAVSAVNTSVTIKGTSSGQANITTASPQPVLVIANLSDPYISADISEDYAARVASGQKATIIFDSLKDKTFTGEVQSVDTVGTTTDGIVTYKARILVHNITSNIKPDMTALITIETFRKDNIIDVPNSAIVTKDGSTYVLDAKTQRQIPVTVGVKGIAKTEITNGLTAGSVIVANPN